MSASPPSFRRLRILAPRDLGPCYRAAVAEITASDEGEAIRLLAGLFVSALALIFQNGGAANCHSPRAFVGKGAEGMKKRFPSSKRSNPCAAPTANNGR